MPGQVTTVAVTLSPAVPVVDITGTIDAYGAGGVYVGVPFYAAVFGPADGNFHVHNRGTIESDGTAASDAGILLGAVGHVVNAGSILAGTGVEVFGGAGGGIDNAGDINATLGTGMYLQGAGTVENTDVVKGLQNGIVLAGGGYVLNTGVVDGAAGIVLDGGAGSYVYNSGFVKSEKRDGINLSAAGSVTNTGQIKSAHIGVVLAGGGIVYNYGNINAVRDGIYAAGGTIFNYAKAKITGAPFGIYLSNAGDVKNAGEITGESVKSATLGAAIDLAAGGSVYNQTGGMLTGMSGVVAQGGYLDVRNKGVIYGTGGQNVTNAAAIYAALGADVINDGTILGASGAYSGAAGVVIAGAAGKVTNTGLISGYFAGAAVLLIDGGDVANRGTIENLRGDGIALLNGGSVHNTGYVNSIYAGGGATVTNNGTIRGSVELAGGGTLTNYGAISNYEAVGVFGGGTVVNAGKIMATSAYGDSVYFQSGFNNRLVLQAGSELVGAVYGGGGALELAAGKSAGTVNLNGRVTGFTNVTIDHRADWVFGPGSSLASTLGVEDDGMIMAQGTSGLTIDGPLFGHGTVDSGKGALTLDGRVGARLDVKLGATGDTLYLGDAKAFAGTIENFTAGDTIDLTGVAASLVTGSTFVNSVLTVYEGTVGYQFTFSNPGSFAHEKFSLFRDHGDLGITLSARSQMSFVTPSASGATASATALAVPAVSYASSTPAAVPSSTGTSGFLDSVLQQTLSALAPVVTLQG